MKQGLINGTYHIQLSKEEILAHRKAVSIALPILRVTEPQEIYKEVVETLENMEPKFTP